MDFVLTIKKNVRNFNCSIIFTKGIYAGLLLTAMLYVYE